MIKKLIKCEDKHEHEFFQESHLYLFTFTVPDKQDRRGTVKTCPPSEKIETSHACASLPPLSNGPDDVKI